MSQVCKTNRLEWIDALRAFAIVLVIIGHCAPNCYMYFLFTSPVKIPLFFVITGFVFNPRDGRVIPFLKNLFVKIVIPWLILGLLPIAVAVPVKGIDWFFQYFLQMLSGVSIWFMPCLIYAEIIWFFCRKYAKSNSQIIIASVCFAIAGLIFADNHILDYGMINRAFIVQLFMSLGFIFRTYIDRIKNTKSLYLCILIALYMALIGVSYIFYPGESIDVHTNCYYNIVLCFTLIVIGCCTVFMIASRLKHITNFISFLGQNTLLLYMWSPYVIQLCHKLESMTGVENVNSFPIALITSSITCTICCVISIAVNKYAPFIVGKKYVK